MKLPGLRVKTRDTMIAVLVLGGILGWLAYRARVQRNAVDVIRNAGGYVFYYGQEDIHDRGPSTSGASVWKSRLASCIGRDYVASVRSVFLYVERGVKTDPDQLMTSIGRLSLLEDLYANSMPITDSRLAAVEGLPHLKTLFLGFTDVSDSGLLYLGKLSHLEHLELCGDRITDAGLAKIAGLTQLRTLDLRSTDITDAGLPHLAKLTNLNRLILNNTRISDAGLAHLMRLPRLTCVGLSETEITDAGFRRVAAIKGIASLSVGSTQVSDAAIEQVEKTYPNLAVDQLPTENGYVVFK